MGLLLAVVITAASVQDRDAARPLLWNLHRTSRRIRLIWADAVYTGKLGTWAAAMKMTPADRPQAQPARLRGAAPPLGGGADLRLDQQAPPHRPRLRAAPGHHETIVYWSMVIIMHGASHVITSHISYTHLSIRTGSFCKLLHV